ncbi:GNAT family N-acetyltransferase [Listeria monocytogenes]|uniref:GNAT family N-acetyltransferase n=1 Tax=Listeria monocytogenes TaxID=1639 RepID=UPI0008545558|nr:N-acetyltransferase [Listeria monocytogenes]EAC8462403.1 N-acetyltransferase [Listeria monocytogenes]EAD7602426.1 N-acetyltransferase [Listeria monocytogenes]EAF8227540.1 N-acetyltransferase [Listeria monocytogenes]EAG2315655.1 N-acetyltransferase [Listeria monocytogenes]EAG3566926.1 N-acetyltransferase [Listeria monocytogenes]
MNIKIRNEQPNDYRKVEEITREAFWNLYCPGCNEHFIVHNLRKHEDFIEELAFVIMVDDEIIGSIHYSKSKIIAKDGNEYEAITFGPVSILPKLHRQGFGRLLIEHSIQAARNLGYKSIIIGGYPYHYETYGFVGAKKYGLSLPDGNFYTGIMALPLEEGALDGISGMVYFSEAMEPDETRLADFDKTFPYKEKKIQDSQLQFERTISQLDTKNYN